MTRSLAAPRIARAYFALQALAGVLWWAAVFTLPAVRRATLGGLDPVAVAVADIPLFVLASALAALLPERARRWAMRIVVPWTLLVTAALAAYATATGRAGWGAVIMAAASCGGVAAWSLAEFGRIPAERLLRGPLSFGVASDASPRRQLETTLLQMIGFWALFLVVLPAGLLALETRWRLHAEFAALLPTLGGALLLCASGLGLWSAVAMSLRGEGTPLPSASARRLVVSGPYRWVRNPMALAGIAQALGVGLLASSWFVIVYALCGAVSWHALVRPLEEADLAARFGDEFADYRRRVRCWVPRIG